MTELQESAAQESPREFDVVERARQAVDAWDRFAVWAPTRVPGVRVCLDLVRDLLAEVERLREWKRMHSADVLSIRAEQGEFYPCRADIFAATYEAVTSDE